MQFCVLLDQHVLLLPTVSCSHETYRSILSSTIQNACVQCRYIWVHDCSTAVDRSHRNEKVVGSNNARFWAFSILIISSNLTKIPEGEVVDKVPGRQDLIFQLVGLLVFNGFSVDKPVKS